MKSSCCTFCVCFTGRFFHAGALAAVMALGVSCQADSRREGPGPMEDSEAALVSQKTDVFLPSDLIAQFSDDFNKDYGAPHHFDMTHWIKWKGDVRTENGYAMYGAVAAPGQFGVAGIGTRAKYFNPGLRGTNGVEVTLLGYVHKHAPPKPTIDEARMMGVQHGILPLTPRYLTGMVVTISNVHATDRDYQKKGSGAVQVFFDVTANWGLNWWLARGILGPTIRRSIRRISRPGMGGSKH